MTEAEQKEETRAACTGGSGRKKRERHAWAETEGKRRKNGKTCENKQEIEVKRLDRERDRGNDGADSVQIFQGNEKEGEK